MAVAATPRAQRLSASPAAVPLRILTAVPIGDDHDSAPSSLTLELARRGIEVIDLGQRCPAHAITRAAVQEDVHAIGLSSCNGGHRVFFKEVVDRLRARGAGDIPVFVGGTFTPADERVMKRQGTARIFSAGTPFDVIATEITRAFGRTLKPNARLRGDRALARAITLAEAGTIRRNSRDSRRPRPARPARKTFVVGVVGPGGAGKSTLIDELASRFLQENPAGRIAILANDPSHPGPGGAILGSRASMIHAQDDRVFFRSLATRGSLTGLSAAAPAAISLLRASGAFDLILVESVGIGQESDPFRIFRSGPRLVDATLFVLAPYYGGRLQLQKIGLLAGADLVILNQCDHAMANTAHAEIRAHLDANGKSQPLHATTAVNPHDPGTTALFAALAALAGWSSEPAGGERPCHLQILS